MRTDSKNDCREEVTIFDSYEEQKETLIKMLSEIFDMSDGHLGQI